MIENSTTIYEEAYESELKESITETDAAFEANIKLGIQSLAKEPTQNVIDSILSYSKSLVSK
ncbi:hypothetical protein [Sphingobacterium paucimobilis]|uniref:Uncharacterized protein n=1 Tax=Sphingobacterium paucimobilis HER1398 TaxID=1346330 RepID=U2JEB4_9SPHI|nr:hypothetical protein [Sphingobacterium paucimobilis]ERJ61013.1 hypothetical protein M472_19860 [Sphingobacterium paucimobilis HER1398]